jgi:hypothetical protein
MEGEIASKLTNLPNHEAKVKTVKGETHIVTLPPTRGVTGSAFDARRDLVQEHTRQAYCRPFDEVEREIAERQTALMEEAERIQGRREAVEPQAGQEDGKGQFRPSRRHKEPPRN